MLTVVGAVALFAAPAVAADDVKWVKLVNPDTGKVLGVTDDSDEAGARVALVKDTNAESQQWKVEKDGEVLKVTNRKSGKVLDVFQASADEGAAVIQWDEKTEENDNQRWSWDGDGKAKRLKGKSSGLVLDVDGDGKIVQKKADDKAKTQLWEVADAKK
jgi:hypothetical protein